MKKKKIAVITGIVAAVVILGGIATYVYVFKNNHSAPEIKDGVTDTQSSWNTDTHHIAAGNGGYYNAANVNIPNNINYGTSIQSNYGTLYTI